MKIYGARALCKRSVIPILSVIYDLCCFEIPILSVIFIIPICAVNSRRGEMDFLLF